MREAPSRVVVKGLLGLGASICAYDPVAIEEARRILGEKRGITYAGDPHGVEGVPQPDFEHMRNTMKTPVVFDARNIFEPAIMHRYRIEYHGIGRPSAV